MQGSLQSIGTADVLGGWWEGVDRASHPHLASPACRRGTHLGTLGHPVNADREEPIL